MNPGANSELAGLPGPLNQAEKLCAWRDDCLAELRSYR